MDNGTCPSYESNFTLAFSPSSTATVRTSDCDSGTWTEDICIDSPNLSFSPGQCEISATVHTRQDFVLEGPEKILLYVINCSNCVSNLSHTQPMEIIIDDTLDCELHTCPT